jgi:hypothetical protein
VAGRERKQIVMVGNVISYPTNLPYQDCFFSVFSDFPIDNIPELVTLTIQTLFVGTRSIQLAVACPWIGDLLFFFVLGFIGERNILFHLTCFNKITCKGIVTA